MKSTVTMLVFVLGGILISTVLAPTPALARLAPYDGIGGNGGAPFRLDCGEYGVLVGLNGRSGVVVDQVTGLCVKIDPVSGIWVGGVYETTHAGGTGGRSFRKVCPVGQALTGIQCGFQPQAPRNGHEKPGIANGDRPQSGAREGPQYQQHTWVHLRQRTLPGALDLRVLKELIKRTGNGK